MATKQRKSDRKGGFSTVPSHIEDEFKEEEEKYLRNVDEVDFRRSSATFNVVSSAQYQTCEGLFSSPPTEVTDIPLPLS